MVSQPFQPYTLIQSTSALVGADAALRAPAQAALFDAQIVRRTFNGSFSREMLAVQLRSSVQRAEASTVAHALRPGRRGFPKNCEHEAGAIGSDLDGTYGPNFGQRDHRHVKSSFVSSAPPLRAPIADCRILESEPRRDE